MPETTPLPPLPDEIDAAELDDPMAAVVAVELASGFVRLCMCQTEPMVSRLVRYEAALRRPGGIELEKRILALRLYRLIDAQVFALLSRTVPLSHAESALARVEVLLREQFAEVAGTAASYLLSDGREAAIQMATVATTMAAREVRTQVAGILAQTRHPDEGAR